MYLRLESNANLDADADKLQIALNEKGGLTSYTPVSAGVILYDKWMTELSTSGGFHIRYHQEYDLHKRIINDDELYCWVKNGSGADAQFAVEIEFEA